MAAGLTALTGLPGVPNFPPMFSGRFPLVFVVVCLLGALGVGVVVEASVAEPTVLGWCDHPLAGAHHEAPDGDAEESPEKKEDQEDPYMVILRALRPKRSMTAPKAPHVDQSEVAGRLAVFRLLRPPRAV